MKWTPGASQSTKFSLWKNSIRNYSTWNTSCLWKWNCYSILTHSHNRLICQSMPPTNELFVLIRNSELFRFIWWFYLWHDNTLFIITIERDYDTCWLLNNRKFSNFVLSSQEQGGTCFPPLKAEHFLCINHCRFFTYLTYYR